MNIMKCIDLRSDTVTHPTEQMRAAMRDAKVGDDVYCEDPTVNELEQLAANLLGKEAALYVPTGIMGNEICVMVHVKEKGKEIILGEHQHIALDEAGGPAVISGAQMRTLKMNKNGEMDLTVLENAIRKEVQDWYPSTGLICLENATHGKAVSLEYMRKVREIANKYKIPVHLDGARVFNAAIALQVDPKEITKYADSVMACLSKGLCCPIGSVIAGSKEFIKNARHVRKILGGGMRHIGVLAAPGILALKEMVPQLKEDHRISKLLAQELDNNFSKHIRVIKEWNDINMVFFEVIDQNFDHSKFVEYMLQQNIKICSPSEHNMLYRFAVHHYIRETEIAAILTSIKQFFSCNK